MPALDLPELLALRDDAYAFALSKLGRQADAEDAVQEAYAKILAQSGNRPAGEGLKFWFLRVLGNVILDQKRGAGRRRAREDRVRQENTMVAPAPEADRAQDELRDALAAAVAALDENHRVAITLHYMQGLTFAEAASVAGMPEGSLSSYASRGLKVLRERLAREGHAVSPALLAAAPMVKAPPELTSALESLIARHAQGGLAPHPPAEPTARGLPAAPAEPSRFPGAVRTALVAVPALAAAAMGGWIVLSPSGPATTSAAPGATVTHPPASQPDGFLRVWNFKTDEAPAGIKLLQGSWSRMPTGGPGGAPCMVTEGERLVAQFDFTVPPGPLMLTIHDRPLPPEPRLKFMHQVLWSGYAGVVARVDGMGRTRVVKPEDWETVKMVITDRVSVDADSVPRGSVFVGQPAKGARIVFMLRGSFRIGRIELRSAAPGEVPDIGACLAALDRIEPERRTGVVPLPGMPGMPGGDPGREVSVRYLTIAEGYFEE